MKKVFCSIILFSNLISSAPISISPETLRFKDSQKRDRFFHGVNVVYKAPPYLPITDHFDAELSFSQEDMANLEQWGLNAIRLGVQWPGVEPQQGIYDETYLQKAKQIVDEAAKYNIYTLVDFHQDLLSEKFCGEGIPLWAVKTQNAWQFPRPIQFTPYELGEDQVPTKEQCEQHSWQSYYLSSAQQVAWQSLYDNVDGIQDAFGKFPIFICRFWKKVAEKFNGNEYVIGYELINEPFSGNNFENPLRFLPSYADKQNMMSMYDKLNSEIRSVDSEHINFFEGVTWDNDIPIGFDHVPGGQQFSNVSAISYHFYVPPNYALQPLLDARFKDQRRLQSGIMCTEFWMNLEDKLFESNLDLFDKNLQSYLGWQYKNYANLTGDRGDFYKDGQLNNELINVVSRTYAQAVAGNTNSMRFDKKTKEFNLSFDLCSSCGETEIYLNEQIHYPNGFDVELNTGALIQYQPKKNRVHFKINPDFYLDAPITVQIKITPKNTNLIYI